ncbi:MAG: hypothetical protein QXQ54_08065 [Thermoplasmata archaeon]
MGKKKGENDIGKEGIISMMEDLDMDNVFLSYCLDTNRRNIQSLPVGYEHDVFYNCRYANEDNKCEIVLNMA